MPNISGNQITLNLTDSAGIPQFPVKIPGTNQHNPDYILEIQTQRGGNLIVVMDISGNMWEDNEYAILSPPRGGFGALIHAVAQILTGIFNRVRNAIRRVFGLSPKI